MADIMMLPPEEIERRQRVAAERIVKAAAERRRAISLLPVEVEYTAHDRMDMMRAERMLAAGDATGWADLMREVEARARSRAESTQVHQGLKETVAQEQARGERIETPRSGRGEGPKPARRILADGLDHLKHKLTPDQHNTGRKFEAFWRAVHRSDTKSCLNVMEGGKGHAYNAHEAYSYAQFKLTRAFDLLGGHNGMWTALVQICGEGKRPAEVNEDRRQYEKLEAQLDCALSLLVRHWGV